VIEEVSSQFPDAVEVVSFLTSTNTLGQGEPSLPSTFRRKTRSELSRFTGLIFADQIAEPTLSNSIAQLSKVDEEFGVPSGYGGLAGEAIHQISLGWVSQSLLGTPACSSTLELTFIYTYSNVHRLRTLLDSSRDPRVKGITLIGVGGASDGASVERFKRAGAAAVAIATALGREGIEVFENIRRERNEL